ncbi:MAG: DNA polymerase III subunit alpha [Firmicutes bacterium]|nr:DNA polymerase III subunit alpha [Bacillota bacterium]
MSNFVHLHNHSEYSLLDGFARIPRMVAKAKECGMNACAITDHGVMYGAVDFYKACKKAGIKAIIGCEAYVAARSRHDKDPVLDKERYHLVLLAKNETGYKNLCKMISFASTEGMYYKPRIDRELMKEYHEGIIALSACLAGEIARACKDDDMEKAKAIALEHLEIFGEGNYYLEIQDHGYEDDRIVNPRIVKLARELNIPLVATNDVHYVDPEDAEYHDILLCIQTGKTLDDDNRMRYDGGQFYFKTAEEMEELFAAYPDAIENTQKIADMCNVEFHFAPPYYLPEFPVPEGFTPTTYLRHLCEKGLMKRYGAIEGEVKERFEYELSVILQMGFPSYFLITWDMINYAKEHGIMVGPGRGSAAGSIVAYALGITDIEPLRYSLLFERFLNPSRISMPDIDTDFCIERRGEVFQYLGDKYGHDHVSQIITFGTMKAKLAVRDVGRVLNMSYAEADRVAKQIPDDDLKMTIGKALERNPDLKKMYDEEPMVRRLLTAAQKIEGMPRHHGLHAAGLVIAPEPVYNYLPIQAGDDGGFATQFAKETVEEMGLLKMDLLGLRNLTVIRDALNNIKMSRGEVVDISAIPMDDKETFDMLGRGEGNGVFQLESEGMQRVMRDLQPANIAEITALVALYRPGPINGGMIDEFVDRKFGRKKIEYPHPLVESILQDTYGVIVYQEQVMLIATNMAGFKMSEADYLRKAMGKKKMDIIVGYREQFVEGAKAKGVDEKIATEIFDLMVKFAEYGFNKSHSVAYAVVCYQTAYLKRHYTAEYSAALLSSLMDKTDKLTAYINECRRLDIQVLPPDINESRLDFTVVNGNIRFGLAAVKNVGRTPSKLIVEERDANGPYKNLQDFCERVSVNTRIMESLITAGAFDSFELHRAQMMAIYPKCMQLSETARKEKESGLMNLFADFEDNNRSDAEAFPEVQGMRPFTREELLKQEKDMIGLFLTGHLLENYTSYWHDYKLTPIKELKNCRSREKVHIAGMVSHVKIKSNKQGKRFAMFDIEDLESEVHCFVFERSLDELREFLTEDAIVVVYGPVRVNEDDVTFSVEEAAFLKNIRSLNVPSSYGAFSTTRKNEDVDYYYDVKIDDPEDMVYDVDSYSSASQTEELPGDFVIPDISVPEPEEKKVVRRLYLNISPGPKGKEEELAARKIFACHRGEDVAYSFYKEKNTVRPFGITVRADDELIKKLEPVFGKERIFVKIVE